MKIKKNSIEIKLNLKNWGGGAGIAVGEAELFNLRSIEICTRKLFHDIKFIYQDCCETLEQRLSPGTDVIDAFTREFLSVRPVSITRKL